MIQEKEKLQPIGTVVELESIDDLYMITGYFRVLITGEIMDYSAVRFPDGDTGPDSYILFNQDMIKSTVSKGLSDDDFEIFAKHITEVEADVHEGVQESIKQTIQKNKRLEFKGLD